MRRFEFCLQLKCDMKSFTTVIKYGETGHDAYAEVIAEYPNHRVFCWGEFKEEA